MGPAGWLVVAETALALVPAAGLLVRGFVRLQGDELGVDPRTVLSSVGCFVPPMVIRPPTGAR
jgi:hypothetical protein